MFFLNPNCADTSRLKFVDSFRSNCVDPYYNQYVSWEYLDILEQKIMNE